ncbi:hypothetical protein B9C53_06495 [Bacillus velezensis]|nr:hypothetical protein B9C53_06495 [Bacillus velezensis]
MCFGKTKGMRGRMKITESIQQFDSIDFLKERGVYLITGGLGELGLIFAQHLAQKTNARLVLTGRSERERENDSKLQELENLGADILYVKADVSNKQQVEKLVAITKERFGNINGVIHSAGVIRDSFVLNKNDEEIQSVLASKVFGTKNLDEVLKDEPLDFFVLFSSVAAVLGNVGQSDYGYANSYMDYFAQWRDAQCKAGKRFGKTLSINWPLWEDGKMSVNDEKLKIMKDGFGMVPLTKERGIPALEYGLQQSGSQLIVLQGEGEKIQSEIKKMKKNDAISSEKDNSMSQPINDPVVTDPTQKVLLNRTETFLKMLISIQTKIPIDKIRNDETFSKFGIESVAIMGMTKTMEEKLGDLSKTLFFEYNNINELAEYLVNYKKEALTMLFGLTDKDRTENLHVQDQPKGRKNVRVKLPENQKKKKSRRETEACDEDIAIIGVSGRYPMAQNLDEFWENLKTGKDCVTEIPENRWDHSQYYDSDKGIIGKTYSKWGGFIDDIEMFDSQFFSILPNEAKFIDPQERLFLEATWNAIEDAGYASASLKGKKVGVFVGAMYGLYQLFETEQFGNKISGRSSFASIANRVSYFFDFHGPSIALDTMCSSSLVALHLGCDSIRKGEAEMVIAGGVNLTLHPNKYLQLSIGNFCSTDGKCRSFGGDGDGYVPGEGVGALVLKPLSKAVEDGDQIYAVIKGSSINSGGKTNGYTVPNPNAQSELIKETLEKSNIDPRTISYIEAHGTGTALGDPIEISGLSKAFHEYTDEKQFCAIGSVKSNIGHSESAAGIAAVTKVLLQMKHKMLVPSIHSKQLNPFIDFKSNPFYVQRSLEEWKQPVIKTASEEKRYPRRAGVSAFGAGGANAHIILEEYEKVSPSISREDSHSQLFILSAKNKERLKVYANQLHLFLETYKPIHPNEQSIKVNTGVIERNYVVKEIIKQEIAEILGISVAEVGYDEPFTDYGLDAYDLTVLHHNLEKKLKLEIPDNELVYHSTSNGLAEYLSSFEAKSLIPEKAEPEAKIDFPLEDLAFTLQVGRESMKERLAIIAGDVNDLKKGLSDYCNGKNDNPNLKQGNTNEFIEKFDILLNGEIAKKQMQKFLEDRDMEKIAELWVMGADVDWEKMYRGEVRQRMSLPTYPFDRKRHWILQVGKDHRLIPNKEIIKNDPDDSIVTKIQEETPVLERPYYLSTEDDVKLTDAILEYLKQMFSEVLNIPTGYLSPHEEFESYGIDSIHINQLNRFFEQVFGTLPATLMFTYKNLYTLSKYFVEKQRGKIITLLNSLNDHQIAKTGNIRPEKPVPFSKDAVPQTVAEEKISEDEQGIAIIGISGTFPQAENMDEFMRNLMNGKDSITEIPKERWDHRKYPDISCKWGGFVADADKFDPQFFNISPLNAAFMDPQERLFLQAVWSCLEDAGYTPESLGDRYDEDQRGNVAVYAGVTFNTYGLSGAAEVDRGNAVPINSQIYSVANRVSYLLNLRGPSLSVDTACSSSLYAIHLGCESILRDECDMAIAGGVNLTLHPSKYITLDSAKFLASDGHCRSFGKGGDGYVPGEGVGAVLLKPLWKAKRDRDHIYGVIKGSAVNHDGKTNGYSVPNPVAQKEVIKKALKKANVDPRTISYVEAHGTGTSLGDPIEITALTDAYAEYTSDKQFCSIGSVKSNIGHPEAAAGIAQVAKVLLQMKHKMLLPSRLNTEEINPDIQFAETPFYVQMKAEEWKQPTILNGRKTKCPRRSGISSFGVGGVNVHMIIEEYEPERRPIEETQKNPVIIPLSAKNESALKRYATKLFHYLVDTKNQDQKVPDLRDIAFTLQTGRKAFPYRVAFIASEYDELRKMVEKFLNEGVNGIKHIRGLIAGKAIPASKGIKPGDYSEVSAESNLYEMAAKWVEGNETPFSELYKGFLPYRISLPVYPYEKEKYWMYRTPEKAVPFEEKLEMSISDKSVSPCKEEEPLSNGSDMTFLYQLANSFESEQIPKMIHYIQEIFASLLGFTEGRLPDPEQGFFELGLESIAIAEGYNMLQRVFNIELDEQIFFNYPNIVEVSKYILPMLNLEELEILSEPEDFCGLAETEEAAIDQNRTLFIDPVRGGEEDEALFNKIDQMSEEELIEMLEMEISEK